MQQHITIVEYNPEWPGIFKYESEKIRKILGDGCVRDLSYRKYIGSRPCR